MRALSIAATGMDAQQKRVEVISNNLANMNTTAYNTRRAEFADLHYQIARAAGSSSSATGDVVPEGVQLGMGVRTSSISIDSSITPSPSGLIFSARSHRARASSRRPMARASRASSR